MPENKDVNIGILGIRTAAFFVNEDLYKNDGSLIDMDFTHKIKSSVEVNILKFILRVSFYYQGERDKILFDIHTENTFKIEEFQTHVLPDANGEGRIAFNENAWATIVGLSISHTRALLSTLIAPTVYFSILIPIVNPLVLTKQMFPDVVVPEPENK